MKKFPLFVLSVISTALIMAAGVWFNVSVRVRDLLINNGNPGPVTYLEPIGAAAIDPALELLDLFGIESPFFFVDSTSTSSPGLPESTPIINYHDISESTDAGGSNAAAFLPGAAGIDADSLVKNEENNAASGAMIADSHSGTISDPATGIINRPKITSAEFVRVGDEYFSGALFIGDSRVEGLRLYSGWDQTIFIDKIGITVWTIFDKPIAEDGSGNGVTLIQVLETSRYDKIYIEIGMNEMGTGTAISFADQYSKLIETIKQYQPGSLIFIQGIIYVTNEIARLKPHFASGLVDERNTAISKLADGIQVFFIDPNEVLSDELHQLNPAYSFDGAHLKAEYYDIWKDYLKAHGIR